MHSLFSLNCLRGTLQLSPHATHNMKLWEDFSISIHKLLKLIFILVLGFINKSAHSTILPTNYKLIEAVPQSLNNNQVLHDWINRHTRSVFKANLTKLDFLKYDDKLSFLYIQARKKIKSKKMSSSEKKFLADELWSSLQDHGDKEQIFDHPLAPYVNHLIHLLRNSRWTDKHDYFNLQISDPNGLNCPSISFIKKRLTDKNYIKIKKNEDYTNFLLKSLHRSNNFRFVKDTLRTFIHLLPRKSLQKYKENLLAIQKSFPAIETVYPALFTADKTTNTVQARLTRTKRFARKRKCYSARTQLLRALKKKQNNILLTQAMQSLKSVGDCFRRRGTRHRIRAWKNFVEPMEKAFGFDGWARTNLELARYYWNDDKFTHARKVIDKLWKESKLRKDRSVQAKTLYLQARIDENQQLYFDAVKNYSKFIRMFPEQEEILNVRQSLLITYIGLRRWQETLKIADQIIYAQEEQRDDDRQVSVLGMALFWGGRAAVEIGKTEIGLEYWKRGAREFFSSYYGAMCHYMIEKFTNKKFVLQPTYNKKFTDNFLVDLFPRKSRRLIERIELLLRLNMKKEAICEAKELPNDLNSPENLLAKALLFHAADHWLESIKVYGKIPRSFRKILPIGVEQILFPKKYTNTIESYSKKIGLDPDLVYSIIRQESVFNPRAYSGAGAKGLMQLMNLTAKKEAKRLRRSYVSYREKKKIIKKVHKSKNLYDSKTNIILGIHYLNNLLKRYELAPVSLAAYNAGPSAVSRWLKKFPVSDPLYFIERIPYKETRDYVRLILRNYFYYKKWYGNAYEELPHLDHFTKYVLAFQKKLTKYQLD